MSHLKEVARPISPLALMTISARTQPETSALSWQIGLALKVGMRMERSSARSLNSTQVCMTQMEIFNIMLMLLSTVSSLQANHSSSGTMISDLSALSHHSPSQRVELRLISLVKESMTQPSRELNLLAAVVRERLLQIGIEREDA